MLTDIMQTFSKMYSESGDRLITDNYKLDNGTYILVDEDGSIKPENILEINEKNYDEINSEKFIVMDYLSKIFNTNKCIDNTSRLVHSNNYLTFWVKKDIIKDKLNERIIDKYYDNLLNPKLKYEKK